MHFNQREHNFWGGWGIVGTSPPLGSGLAFAHKYLKKPNVVVTIYGDSVGNQVSITSRLLGFHMFTLLVASTSYAH
jgi:TPP-dependent pyruvate/acetoin dehydrogenase alpha subunit